ncbi:nitroreductase family protein [Mucisphaera calidilacus]|uniref:Malonic semialdehyde reductase n=1 Tax=Mucisphaera calidilacus TaxID=2527982 RepID=A0A518BXZ5_9BACT|nr:nitroreductase family protein [Mucisphaera calidilacus]QDU71826.1 malonic semialdehyde reductase [Mucisphaera calidilacus]
MENPAPSEHPMIDVAKRRWSPYGLAPKVIPAQKIRSLMEAARWAASSFNEQPWRFMLAPRSDEAAFEKALGCLAEANQAWAKNAGLLILTAVRESFTKNDKPNRVAEHDLGLAVGNLSLQATAMGLFVHQMAGVDLDAVRDAYGVPEGFRVMTAIAVGHAAKADEVPAELRARDEAERVRNDFDTFVFGTSWGEASAVFKD